MKGKEIRIKDSERITHNIYPDTLSISTKQHSETKKMKTHKEKGEGERANGTDEKNRASKRNESKKF